MKTKNKYNHIVNLLSLFRVLSKRQEAYFGVIIFASILSSLAEAITLSSLVPFIEFLMGSENPTFGGIADLFSARDIGKYSVTLILICAILLATLLRLALIWMNINFTNDVTRSLALRMMDSTLQREISFFKNNSSDEIISAMSLKVGNVSSTILAITNLISASIIALGILAFVLSINLFITLPIAVFIILFYWIILQFAKNKISDNGRIIAKMQSNLISVLQGSIGSIRDILLNRKSQPFLDSYDQGISKMNFAGAVNTFLNQSPRYLFEATFMICVIIFGLSLMNKTDVSKYVSLIALLAFSAQKIIPLFQQIYSNTAIIMSSNQAIKDVLSFVDKKRPNDIDIIRSFDYIEKIVINKINFSYDGKEKLLQGISANIKRGDFLVICGPTGSGKSSLLDIILGLLMPNQGYVQFNEEALSEQVQYNFRGTLAFVPQKIFILNESIEKNVAFSIGDDDVDVDRVIWCCKLARFLDEGDVSTFLKKQVGENGSKLSGGQIQRLALARALYQDPDVLVLDEFGSGLDQSTLSDILVDLKNAYVDKIIIFVTHSDTVMDFSTQQLVLSGRDK